MSYKEELLYHIADNLNINKFFCEDEHSYTGRILYSAIANWIFTSSNDISFEENYYRKGVSKSYITRRISKVVEEYLELYPGFREYLDGKEPNEVVSQMRGIIEDAGFLTPTGFDEFVNLPPLKEMKANDELYLIKGLCKASEVLAIGLGIYTHIPVCENSCSIKEMFYIPELDAATWTKEHINSINWKNGSNLSNEVQFFDPKTKNTFHGCWKEEFPKDVEVTIYKKHDRDYGFVRKYGDSIIGFQIPDHLIGVESAETDNLFDNDVRRFMYGLKCLHNNNAKSKLIIEKGVCILQLFNALPGREFTALQFMSWRKKGLSDDFSYFIPLELLCVIKELLSNLNINLVEVKNG
jgi:hypothetical protein